MIDVLLTNIQSGSEGKKKKKPACNTGDPGLIPELWRSLGVGNGNPLSYSCLYNSMDRGAWWGAHGDGKVADVTEGLTLSLSSLIQTSLLFT